MGSGALAAHYRDATVRKLGQGEGLIDEFALAYLKSGLAAWGVRYIDSHFLPY